MTKTKLVCFDLDDTLIREIHSVMYLCKINDRLAELIEIEKREANSEFTWIEADYYKARLAKGLFVDKAYSEFNNTVKPIENIHQVIKILHQMNIKCILITAGPKQVAEIAGELWGFNKCYGSDYEVIDGMFTGEILEHLGDKGKVTRLAEYCKINGIESENCVVVGDGASDIEMFKYCRTSIAINYSHSVIGKATNYLITNNLMDILKHID